MDPTARAERLATPVHQALQGLRLTLEDADIFVPAEASGPLQSHSTPPPRSTWPLLGPRWQQPKRQVSCLICAPLVRWIYPIVLTVVSSTSPSALRRPPVSGLRNLRLLEDRFVAVLRRDHPATGADGSLRMETLATLLHVVISATGEETGFVDAELAKSGLTRHVALHAPLSAAADRWRIPTWSPS